MLGFKGVFYQLVVEFTLVLAVDPAVEGLNSLRLKAESVSCC